MSKNISHLRDDLFDALDMLKKGELTIEQAKAYSEMSQVIINSAKVGVDYIKANGGGEIQFLEPKDITPGDLPAGVVSVTRHRLIG